MADELTAKRKRGRPVDPDALRFHPYGLNDKQREFLLLFAPTGNPTEQMQALLEIAMKMWPNGPNARGGTKRGAQSRPTITPSVKRYAEGRGLTPKNAAAELVRIGLETVRKREKG